MENPPNGTGPKSFDTNKKKRLLFCEKKTFGTVFAVGNRRKSLLSLELRRSRPPPPCPKVSDTNGLRQELFQLSSTLNSTQHTGIVNAHASQYIKYSFSKIIFLLQYCVGYV